MGRVEGASEAPARPVDREKNGRGVYLIIKHGPPRHSLVRYVPCPTRPGDAACLIRKQWVFPLHATHTKHDALFLPSRLSWAFPEFEYWPRPSGWSVCVISLRRNPEKQMPEKVAHGINGRDVKVKRQARKSSYKKKAKRMGLAVAN